VRYKAKTTRKAFEIRLGKEFSKVERAETYEEGFGQWKKLTLYYAEDNLRHVATWMSGEGWIF
jgi:hypothetical protein|tara:strand:- start:627 stop:815 length:189 start_codon:yes stop_codon:yes gene_type:complete